MKNILIIAFLLIVTSTSLQAVSVSRTVVAEDTAVLLVTESISENITARVSGVDTDVMVFPFEETGAERYTVFLLDTSINPVFHDNALALLNTLIENKLDNEQFSIVVVDDNFRQIIGFTYDRFDLAQAVAGITWSETFGGMYTAIERTLEVLASIQPNQLAFTQVVVITDGGRGFVAGIARDEILLNIGNAAMPVHTIGILHPQVEGAPSNVNEVNNVHAISRVSGALSLDFSQSTEISSLTSTFRNFYNTLYQVQVDLPVNFRDGAIRPLELLNPDGVSLLVQDLRMPFADGTTEEPPPVVHDNIPPIEQIAPIEPEPETDEEEENSSSLGGLIIAAIVSAVVVFIIVVVVVVLLVLRKNKRPVKQPRQESTNNSTEIFNTDDGATEILIGGNDFGASGFYLILNDLSQPHKKFEIKIDNKIEIGREPQPPGITIDYSGKISRRHCSVQLIDGELWITDMGSANKTFVNNKAIQQPVLLRDSDTLSIGDLSYSVRLERR
ncbi:MAG: FHA domain-containing protein [Firmicutes bacterium]|nr:FHA domain-containing protein [Bacillota bacterium]